MVCILKDGVCEVSFCGVLPSSCLIKSSFEVTFRAEGLGVKLDFVGVPLGLGLIVVEGAGLLPGLHAVSE